MEIKIMNLLVLFALFALILVAMQVPFVTASDLRVTLEDYTPKPVAPGNFFVASFRVDNVAGSTINGVKVELDVNSPLFIEGSDSITIDSIDSEKSETVTFNIGVKSSAQSGFETIDIDWSTETDSGSDSFSIQVKAIETTLVIESVESIPSEIAPGEEARIKLKLRNNANILLKDVKVKLNLNSADLPFAPLGTVTERNINSLQPGSIREIEFKIIALADASSKIYKVPLEISYFDEFGQEYNITDMIALIVGSQPDLKVNIAGSNLIEGQRGTVTIDIVNSGLTDAKFLSVLLISSNEYEIIGSNSIYIGDVDSDDIEDLEFELVPQGTGIINLPVQLIYRDANSKLYSENVNLNLRVYSAEEAKSLGLTNTDYTLFLVVGIVIIVIIYFAVRNILRRRRNKFLK